MQLVPSVFEVLNAGGTTVVRLQQVPAGDLVSALIKVETKDVRFRADGVDPTTTVGFLLTATSVPLYLEDAGTFLRAMRFIGVADTAVISVQYFTF